MILIIANARYKGGLSGSDNIYLSFSKYWGECEVWQLMDLDYKPFIFCYIHRIIIGCFKAIIEKRKFDFVYSASDFWMDSIPAFILKLKGNKWVASYYLCAPKNNLLFRFSQFIIRPIIKKFANCVCVTNKSITIGHKYEIEVHGGVDLSKVKFSKDKCFDAVFCGRFHRTKGIFDLLTAFDLVIASKPNAKLAIIGGGDDGIKQYLTFIEARKKNYIFFGFLDNERFDVYAQSKMVIYPATYDHFSMSPVEAMACGCPMIAFDLPVMKIINPEGTVLANGISALAEHIIKLMDDKQGLEFLGKQAQEWANKWDWSKRAPEILKKIREVL
jgi:glycosyltransferase involved in cell wall biosynthesis